MSSAPATATSAGTRRPSSAHARSAPVAETFDGRADRRIVSNGFGAIDAGGWALVLPHATEALVHVYSEGGDAAAADATKVYMGLTTWKNAPHGKILKSDVAIARNYLIEQEIKELERIVTMYLDYAENQAARQIPMRMADWVAKLDAFLKFNEYEVLTSAGSVSAEVARRLAEEQYATFRVQQDQRFESDFEKEVKRIEKQDKEDTQ